jgi:rRNA maturation RNase YbeY
MRRIASPHTTKLSDGPSAKSLCVRRGAFREDGAYGGAYLGDVAIAPAVARRNARLSGRSLDGEMKVLILHGVLHLLGYDHETDHGQMERRERRLRRHLGMS